MNFLKQIFRHCKKGVLLAGMSMVLLLMPAMAQSQNTTEKKIPLTLREATMKEAFAEIKKQSGLSVVFSELINKYSSNRVTIESGNISVGDALAQVLKDTNLQVYIPLKLTLCTGVVDPFAFLIKNRTKKASLSLCFCFVFELFFSLCFWCFPLPFSEREP